MTNSVWPYDTHLEADVPVHNRSMDILTCFVALPSRPRERWDEIYSLIDDVVTQIAQSYHLPLRCIRAIDIVSTGMIHPEIWELVRTADIVVCDVTGHNGNVVLELGVAAAWRRKESVIILRDEDDEKEHLFDIMPARHLQYRISYHGIEKLAEDLQRLIMEIMTTYPFQQLAVPPFSLPFEAKLTDGKDDRRLYTEDITHRRMLSDCLEFGSPFNYRHCWMSLGNLKIPNVRVRADMKMTLDTSNPDLPPFMGIMVRSSSYFSNWGHLVHIRTNGVFALTVREADPSKWHDEPLGTVPNYDIRQNTHFDVSIDDRSIKATINGVTGEKELGQLGHVFTDGRILFIAGFSRVGISNIIAEAL